MGAQVMGGVLFDDRVVDETADVPNRHSEGRRQIVDGNQATLGERTVRWSCHVSGHPLTVNCARHGSLPDFEEGDWGFWTDRRGVDALLRELAVAI